MYLNSKYQSSGHESILGLTLTWDVFKSNS